MKPKPLVIYHNNCADGFGAAFAAWLKLGDEAEYYPMQYGYDLLPDFKGREVYMVDFSWKKEHMHDLFSAAKCVVWLDHHKTAFEMWCDTERTLYMSRPVTLDVEDYHHITLDNNKSGAMLAWEHFHPGVEAPIMFKHIDDYDRWQFKIEGTKAFNKAIWSYSPFKFETWLDWFNNPLALPGLMLEGAAILRAHNQNVQSVVKGAARKCVVYNLFPPPDNWHEVHEHWEPYPDECHRTGLAANCPPHLTSDVGHELATQSGTFGLCWTLAKDKLVANCSLRSNGDYDVSAIAKALGGGGHKNAAGFEVPITTLMGWLR